jgi:hypothetical protein
LEVVAFLHLLDDGLREDAPVQQNNGLRKC